MARLAVLVPRQNMLAMAEELFDEYPQIQRHCVEWMQSDQVAARAQQLAAEGCDVIMARGLQARLIKRAVELPVVEIRVMAQELGLLVQEIRDELQLERPAIAVIGFSNMLCDTSQFDRLFQVRLKSYRVTADADTDYEQALCVAFRTALDEGCQGVIGGDVVCRQAQENGLAHRFIPGGRESLRSAFDMARHVCYAIDQEKINRSEISTMLENTPGGIIQLDRQGMVLRANAAAYNLVNLAPGDLLGNALTQVFPVLSPETLKRTLVNGEETNTVIVPPSRRETVVNLAPIFLEKKINGAILMLQEGRRVLEMNSELRHELYLRGYMARWRFEQIPVKSAESRRMVEQAKRVANFSAPILLTGEAGSGKEILAQCIHNEGITRGNAFVSLDCRAYQADTLDTLLFGTVSARRDALPSLVEAVQDGTLFLINVESLSDELQFKLLRLIRGIFLHNGSNKPMESNVRVIAATQSNLITRVENGEFRGDLYYALNALGIHLSPMRKRREDIMEWVGIFLDKWRERYDRALVLTKGAKYFLTGYDWPGNLNQINSVCEQIVLLSEHRTVDEVFLRRQIEQLTPKILPGTEQVVLYKDERAVEIAALLKKHNGNRQTVADALGVSKTTLWRYMKKYGIDKDYSY